MARHWRDQFRDNNAARAAEEEKRIAESEGWEAASDPGPNARSSRRSLQLGVRSSSASRPQFARGGGRAGLNVRVGGGVPFEIERKPDAPASAPPPGDTAPANLPDTAAPGKKKSLLSKLSSLFGKGEEG